MRPGRTVSRPCPGRGVHRRRQSRMFLIAGLVLCCLGSTQIAGAGINTWTSVGPEGAIVEAVVIDPTTPTTLYAATLDGGVFKSTDAGGSWTAANDGLTVPGVRTLAIDLTAPSILYAGTAGDGVFKSTDGGGSWSAANAGLEFTDVFGLAIDPTTPTTLYAGTAYGGVFKSTDGGGSWRAVFDSWGVTVQGLAIDPRTDATTIYAGTHGYGVFKSTDRGGSWNPVNTGMIDDSACSSYGYNCYAFVGDVTIDPQTPTTLYAEAWTDGFQGLYDSVSFVFKSTDGGDTWNPVLTAPIDSHVQGVTIDPRTPTTLYAVTGDHTGFGAVFRSTDGGGSWSDLSTGLTVTDVRALAVDPLTPTTLYAGTYGGGVFVARLIPDTRADFNADGRSDIVWRHAASGENYLYPMNGTTILAGEGYLRTVADQTWQVAGVGDFDGDGRADILWRNSSTGENYVYLMNGLSIVNEGYLRTVADQNWQVAGVGDFDGDGKDDVLWRNASSGENYVYLMNGLSIASEGYLRTLADTAWEIKGVGDFNGDGKADILWRNATSGENYVYVMNGLSIASEGYLRTVADTAWQVKGVGDFDGDGKADIVWRNNSTGQNYLYLMDGTVIKPTEGYLRTVADTNWQIVAVGDYDGDGKSDLLWRHSSTGENYLYPMDGTTINPTEGYLRAVPAGNWNVASP